MPSRFKTLKALEETTTSTLKLVRDSHLKSDFVQRRFKTADPAELEGLRTLFAELAVLESPRLDRIIEASVDEKGFFVLMPAPLEGISLPEMLQRGPLSAEEFEVLAGQLLDALEVVHDQAIVHGTLTPECVRISGTKADQWKVRLGGFGIGFAAQSQEEEHQIAAYRCAAPEQWQKSPARRRTDIYSLGCLLYESLAGRPAFPSRSLKELRAKHLGRDLPDLSKVAPHVPRWMCDWVMSLIVTDSETRPRKAGVARETFLQRDTAPSPAPSVPEVPVPVAAPAAPVVPAIVSSPVMLPVSQPARNATASTIPIAVGPQVGKPPMPKRPAAPLSAPKAAVRQFSQQPAPRPVWQRPLLWLIAAAVIAIVLWLTMGKSPSTSSQPAAAAGSLVAVSTQDPVQLGFRELGSLRQRYATGGAAAPAPALPSGLEKPWEFDQLVAWFRADLGSNTFDGQDLDKPARLADTVAFWHDFGPLGDDNALGIIPWEAAKKRARLELVQPDSASMPLSTSRHFIVFGQDKKPVAAMGSLGPRSGSGIPFSDAAASGTTLAVLFYQNASLTGGRSQVVHVNFGDGTMALITDEKGRANFIIGGPASGPEEHRARPVLGVASALDATVPTLALASWNKDGRVSVRLRNARGDAISGAATLRSPVKSLQNIAIAGDGYWMFRDQSDNKVPFFGGLAEFRFYGNALNEVEMQALEKEMVARYFP